MHVVSAYFVLIAARAWPSGLASTVKSAKLGLNAWACANWPQNMTVCHAVQWVKGSNLFSSIVSVPPIDGT